MLWASEPMRRALLKAIPRLCGAKMVQNSRVHVIVHPAARNAVIASRKTGRAEGNIGQIGEDIPGHGNEVNGSRDSMPTTKGLISTSAKLMRGKVLMRSSTVQTLAK
jgi:hypothetical protein